VEGSAQIVGAGDDTRSSAGRVGDARPQTQPSVCKGSQGLKYRRACTVRR
jgi:hypothetical protein